MTNVAMLILRVSTGTLIAGHGAQKLFGWFGGGGPAETEKMMEKMELRPPKVWAMAAGVSEFGGGLLTALGLLNPMGPLGIISAMSVASLTAHGGKPIWAQKGGAELPVTNIAVALAIALGGPGRLSLDRALGVRLGRMLVGLAAVGAGAGVAAALAAPKVIAGPQQYAVAGGAR
jgi:putative oxidoreductase